jgi:hypothetical protein
MRDQQRGHLWTVHPYADAIAGDARLRHFKQCATNPVAISNADLVIGKAIDGKVLSELAILEVVPLKLLLPIAIGVELINQHSTMLSPMACKIALTITVKIETSRHHPACYGSLPDSGADHFALPFHIGRNADIY